MGVPFARCLKTAVDIKGEFGTKFCGIIAGDEECYSLFREVFDPVIEMRHDFPMGKKHVTNWDVEAVRGVPLDPDGKYIFSCQLRTARNLRGYLLPPACKQDARRKIEATVVKALLNVGEDHNDDDEVREIHCACLILRPLLACSQLSFLVRRCLVLLCAFNSALRVSCLSCLLSFVSRVSCVLCLAG